MIAPLHVSLSESETPSQKQKKTLLHTWGLFQIFRWRYTAANALWDWGGRARVWRAEPGVRSPLCLDSGDAAGTSRVQGVVK